MGIKYRHTRHLERAREARGGRPDAAPPRVALPLRQRLLVIYSGILLFCAFVLVGQLFLRLQEQSRAGALLRAEAEIAALETSPEGGRALLRIASGEHAAAPLELWAAVTGEHAALREGDRVGVLLRVERDGLRVAEVARFALPGAAPVD